ncbi:MAG: NAD-dependent epimerase/dehydratase family protein [Gemmataceae bacterium]
MNPICETVLVTGGAGFIGQHLVQLLVQRGNRVRVLDQRRPSDAGHTVEWIVGDIRDRDCVRKAVQGCHLVYHLAANPQLWTWPKKQFREVNYLGAVQVMEEALQAGARRILHTSTESILTRSRQVTPIQEDQVVPPHDVIGPYCRSKYLAERHAFALARRGAPIVIVNPTLPVGPGDEGRSPPTQMMLDFCRGKRREYLDAELNLIDVRDVALGMIRAMEVGHPGRRYLLGHENLSIREVFCRLALLTGLPEPRWRVPFVVALTAACFSEIVADVWTRTIPAATLTGVLLTKRRMHFDASRSLAELGLQPRPVAESFQDALAWFREKGWVAPR